MSGYDRDLVRKKPRYKHSQRPHKEVQGQTASNLLGSPERAVQPCSCHAELFLGVHADGCPEKDSG